MDYRVSDADLTSIANAIRTKGGTNLPLAFPDEFVDAIDDISTGGSPTLISKSISVNGTYNASDDSADGYSSVTVAVPTGSRLVSGTFTPLTSEAGTAKTITIPYVGSGYPISCMIYPTAGSHKSGTTIYSSTQRYAVLMFMMVKWDISATPDYTENADKNMATAYAIYKNSSSDPDTYSTGGGINTRTYRNSNATTPHSDTVRFKDSTTLSVYVADTSYGFLPETEYTYDIVYSS